MLDKINRRIHPVTLEFKSRNFESEFRHYRVDKDIRVMRLACFLGGSIYALFSYFDYLQFEENALLAAIIRVGLVMPMAFTCGVLSYLSVFRTAQAVQGINLFLLTIAQIGSFATTYFLETGSAYIAVGTMMLLIYTACLGRIWTKYMYGFMLFIMVSYSIFIFNFLENQVAEKLFHFFSVNSISVVGIIAAYILERNNRVEFFQKKIIELQNSHLKISNDKQNNLIDKLQHLNDDLRRFTYMASHDLKTPVRGIATLTQFIEHDLPEHAKACIEEYLTMMHQNVDRMESLIAGIGKYIDAMMERNPEWINPNTLLEQAIQQIKEKQNFCILYPHNIPKIYMDIQDMKTVWYELIDNAVKHSNQTQPKVEIDFYTRDANLILTITDNGPGIEAAYRQRVFKMFETLSSEKKLYGAGLGLAIVDKILQKYQIPIMIQAPQDEKLGTQIKVIFPKRLFTYPHISS